MSIDVYIPTPFRRATNNKDRVSVEARDVRGLLDELEGRFSGLKGLVRNEAGEVHHHVNLYVNSEAIEALQGLQTSLKDGDEVSIIPALAGGRPALAGGRPALAGGRPALAGGRPVLVNGEPLLLPCRNIQDELHAKDPQRHPRDSRTAYYIDPKDLIAMGRREAQGYRVGTIYHSHIDAGAYFSATDKHNALINGEPAYPEAIYVVVSVLQGRIDDAGAFRWDPAQRDFVPLEWKKPEGDSRG